MDRKIAHYEEPAYLGQPRDYTGAQNQQNQTSGAIAGRSASFDGGECDVAPPDVMRGQITLENIDDVMRFQPWTPGQVDAGDQVREALTAAAKTLLRVCPAGPYRSVALRKILEARMDANASITFRGRF